MTTIQEKARRVMTLVESTREQAREAGVPGAATIGADTYDVAAWVLGRGDSDELTRLRRTVSTLRSDMGSIHMKAGLALRDSEELNRDEMHASAPRKTYKVCYCERPGPGRALRCGSQGEYDPACSCECHIPEREASPVAPVSAPAKMCAACWIDLATICAGDPGCRCACHAAGRPVDPANPAQLVVPKSIEVPPTPPADRAHDFEAAKPETPTIRVRAEEREQPIYEWAPDRIFLSSLQTAEEDTDAVARHLDRFRVENAGQSKKRWASVFRSWLERVRKESVATPLTAPAVPG